jgi:preprotein translocase subunit SecA
MRLFGGEKMKAVMGRIGMSDGEPIYHPMLTKGIEKAQSKVEERNFEIRKHLLDYDDVLNEQRNFIYSQRDEILADTKLTERVLNATLETLDDAIDIWKDGAKKISTKDDADKNFAETLKNIFSISQNKISEIITNGQKYLNKDDILKNELFESLKDELAEKESLAGHENFNMFIRYQYIQAIDKAWLNHLEVLEGLREAVHLRSYGSKNPLTEYKIDGYNIFYDMIESIRLVPMRSVFHVKVQREEEGRKVTRGRPIAQTNAQHIAFDAQAAVRAAASSPYAAHRQGEGVTIVRTGTKVGRNDPCPCGSGKKYKQCCGR